MKEETQRVTRGVMSSNPSANDPPRDEVVITEEILPLGSLASSVVCPTAGAIATFIGTTRDNFEGKRVLRLEYEAYKPMAEREIRRIIQRAREKWEIRHVAISHRIGVVPTTESSVEIAISSAHRRAGLEACQFAIDELKAQVPIWKKEIYDGDATAKWKENAESSVPTIGEQTATSGRTRRQLTQVALLTAAAAVALRMFAIRSRSASGRAAV